MGVDLIDYTYLQKRGLIKKKDTRASGLKADNSGYVELGPSLFDSSDSFVNSNADSNPLGSFMSSSNNSNSSGSSAGSSDSNPLAGFFGGMDSGTTTNSTSTSYYGNENSSASSIANVNSGADYGSMKSKLDDLELKLNSITTTLELITNKLINFENKVNR